MRLPAIFALPAPRGLGSTAAGLCARLRRFGALMGAALLSLVLAACGGDGGPTAPSITTQPASVTVNAGASASFSVTANGSGPLTYQWRRNGSNISGATASTYTLSSVAASDTGAQFSVVVGNEGGTVTSTAATLTVDVAVAPVLTTSPVAQSVTEGGTATFSVSATGSDPLAYQWKRNGVNITGATAASYTTPATTVANDNGATYAVVVSNSAGSASSDAVTLTVTPVVVPASITTAPVAQSVTAGQTATFTVVASGSAPLTYQWKRNGSDITGATAASYTTPATTVAADNGALYSVVVNNAANTPVTSAAVALSVVTADVAVSITSQPSAVSVTAGQAASLTVVAAGTTPRYQWQRDGVAIPGATSPTYTLTSTAVADSGARFTVVVSNSVNSVTSAVATLTVGPVVIPPSIPAAQPGNVSITAPATATFSVAPEGTAPFSYQWRKNGTNISGATAASYTTPATLVADDGAVFSVVVTNSAGSATSRNAVLAVSPGITPVSITTQPADATVTVGLTASFSVVASGTGPLSYQWRKNGANITGATAAQFTTSALSLVDNGARFDVQVSNGAGTVVSRLATLTVQAQLSALADRKWTAGTQFDATGVQSSSSSVVTTATAIDAKGNLTVLFGKVVGDRYVLAARRLSPGVVSGVPSVGESTILDAEAPFYWQQGVTLAVSPAGNAIAGWVSRRACTSMTYNTNPSALCNYYYFSRYLASSGRWEVPKLVGDMYIPSFRAVINDAGDVAAIFPETVVPGESLNGIQLVSGWLLNGSDSFVRRAWAIDVVNGSFIPYDVSLDADGGILLAGTITQPMSPATDIAVYRGAVRSGDWAGARIDLRGASASFLSMKSNAVGQSVVLWSQDNGAKQTVYAGALDIKGGGWTVIDTNQTPASGSEIAAVVDAKGDFYWYKFSSCTVLKRLAGVWAGAAALPSSLCQSVGVPGSPAVAQSGNFLSIHPSTSGWLAFDGVSNLAFNPLPHGSSASSYLLGYSKSMSVLPGVLLLSEAGIGAYVSYNSYSQLPTASLPNGDTLNFVNGWVWYFR